MSGVFADTVYFLALLNARDSLYRQAKAHADDPPGPIVTTEWILVEVGDALSNPPARERFAALLSALRVQKDATIVPASHDLFTRGCALYGERKDKSWSLTDCISFVVMRDLGLDTALTADQHFEQAGFRRLMRA